MQDELRGLQQALEEQWLAMDADTTLGSWGEAGEASTESDSDSDEVIPTPTRAERILAQQHSLAKLSSSLPMLPPLAQKATIDRTPVSVCVSIGCRGCRLCKADSVGKPEALGDSMLRRSYYRQPGLNTERSYGVGSKPWRLPPLEHSGSALFDGPEPEPEPEPLLPQPFGIPESKAPGRQA